MAKSQAALKASRPTPAVANHATPLGALWSQWTAAGLYRIGWGAPPEGDWGGKNAVGADEAGNRIEEFGHALRGYLEGDHDAFRWVTVDPAEWTPFFAEVYQVCRSIPAGQTLTYGQLAARCGRPGGARAIGRAMATNRVALVIPCHRVLASGGHLRGYSGPGGLVMKRWLLDHEGADYAERQAVIAR